MEHLRLVCVGHWGQLKCLLKALTWKHRSFLLLRCCVIIGHDHGGYFLPFMEVVSGFEHDVLDGRRNLIVEDWLAIWSD